MLPLLLVCLAGTAFCQQSSGRQIESEDNANSVNSAQPALYGFGQTYQPAAQQRRTVYQNPNTYSYAPYSFDYVAQGDDGGSSRRETGDASGRVVGSYTITVDDGRQRVVDYVADQNGFRATIDTNEPGTEVQNPADVVFNSAAAVPNANQQTTVYRPTHQYRPRPSNVYSQANVNRNVYSAPYSHYDNHGYGNHGYGNHGHGGYHGYDQHGHRGQAYTSYYNNDRRYHWN